MKKPSAKVTIAKARARLETALNGLRNRIGTAIDSARRWWRRRRMITKLTPRRMVVKRIRLSKLYELDIPESLSCILTREPVEAVEIMIIPVPRNHNEVLRIPLSMKHKKRVIDWLLTHCDTFQCTTLTNRKPYPKFYDQERCMVIETSERNYIVYVRDIPPKLAKELEQLRRSTRLQEAG